MKNINISIVYLFYKAFIVLKIKVVLINCRWSKAPSKAAQNNGQMVLITAQLGVARPDLGSKRSYFNYPRKLSTAGETWLLICFPYEYAMASDKMKLYMCIDVIKQTWWSKAILTLISNTTWNCHMSLCSVLTWQHRKIRHFPRISKICNT